MGSIDRRASAFVGASLLLCVGLVALAGDPTPPPGPIGPTMKPLDEVEPRTAINDTNTPGDAGNIYKITKSGSYYLTENVTGIATRVGIEIAASDVTIDLNGYVLVGVPGSAAGIATLTPGLSNITVRNGTVRDWAQYGIDLASIPVDGASIESVRVVGNLFDGARVGTAAMIRDSRASANGGAGFRVVGAGGSIDNSHADNNGEAGISTFEDAVVSNCRANNNAIAGILSASGALITDCLASNNQGVGIQANSSCTVANCSVTKNWTDGILIGSNCTVRSNNCAFNGSNGSGAGIHATSWDNRIESNNCTSADIGIDVDFVGNFIVRNICSGNTTNWTVAGNNTCLVVQNTPSIAVNGDTGGSAPGTTDPWANFTY